MTKRLSVLEKDVQAAIRKELGDVARYPSLVLWRNNVGQLIDRNGNRVTYGVGGKGGADLIGVYAGRFVAIEIKVDETDQTDEQHTYEQLVTSKGGIYIVLRSAEQARAWAECMRGNYA